LCAPFNTSSSAPSTSIFIQLTLSVFIPMEFKILSNPPLRP
jgi:hypothetical protein